MLTRASFLGKKKPLMNSLPLYLSLQALIWYKKLHK